MTRRILFGWLIGAAVAFTAAGCGRGIPSASFGDAVKITEEALRDLLLGLPPERAAALRTPPDPPLLKRGVYETVLIHADAEAFSRVSRQRISPDAVKDLQRRVVAALDKDLQKARYAARGIASPAEAQGVPMALLARLTPVTEEAGSPQERAQGKGTTILLIRLTVIDPKTGALLSQRDYYSGHSLKR